MDTKEVIARFEAERQALALMDHPNIAKVLDAGSTESGRPYFVMELVRGIPITDYCDQNTLSIATDWICSSRSASGSTRPPEGHHSPRSETGQCAGHAARWPPGSKGHRFWRGQGHRTNG